MQNPTVTISLNEMSIYAHHGVLPDEKTIGAWYTVHLSAQVKCMEALVSDSIEDTVNYALLAEVVQEEMAIPSKLLEHVAYRIFERITKSFPSIDHLVVEIQKKHPPIPGECHSSSVRLEG